MASSSSLQALQVAAPVTGTSKPETAASTVVVVPPFPTIYFHGGNSLATATDLGTASSTASSYYDFTGVSSSSPNDYFKFHLNSGSNANITLTGLTADADVQLLNSTGQIVGYSNYSGSHDEAINTAGLAAGDYYVRVYQYSGSTGFNLGLSATSPSAPSNLIATQTDTGVLSGTRTYSGSVGNNSTSSVYHFHLNNTSHFDLTLTGLNSDADVRLIRDANHNGIVDSGDEITRSQWSGTHAEGINTNLGAGDYYVQVYQYTGNTSYHLSLSTGDWFSSNLSDAGIIGEARWGMATDGGIKRNDMLSIFKEVEKESSVSGSSLTDLRSLVNNGSSFSMPTYVQQLASNVVNGNTANAHYQGGTLGNLYAGSSITQLTNLVNKWFMGTDLPATSATYYHDTAGSLFGTDGNFSYTDIRQGGLGDCYLMASLASLAGQFPAAIRNMFIDNGDGTFTVRLFGEHDGNVTTGERYVTVNRDLPLGYAYFDDNNVGLWVALAEKAYAQFAEQGSTQHAAVNTYSNIEGGWGFQTMPTLSGWTGHYYTNYSSVNGFANRAGNFLSLSDISTKLAGGWALTADTIGSPAHGIVGGHEYMIVSANLASGTVTLYNPWGDTDTTGTGTGDSHGYKTISYTDFTHDFYMINVG